MVSLRIRLQNVRAMALGYPAVLWVLGLAAAYLWLTLWLNKLLVVFPSMYAARPLYAVGSITLLITIGVFFGINAVLIAHQVHLRWELHKHGALMLGSVTASLIGSACPACAVGLFPFFAGVFGTSLSTLPLFGLEFSILGVVLMITATLMLANVSPVCPFPSNGVRVRSTKVIYGKGRRSR